MSEGVRSASATVRENIQTVAHLEQEFEDRRGPVDRLADLIGDFSGSMSFVLVHVIWFVAWFVINTGVLRIGVPRFDPYPFILLAMIVSVEGVLLSTFVLMKQNRMQKKSDTRDHLNLQIDLLAEKEVTKSLQLLRAICRKLAIDEDGLDMELDEMAAVTSVDLLAERVQREIEGREQV